MKRKETRLLALLLAAMMMLTACGQDKAPASDANSGTTTPSTDTPAEPTETKAEPVKDWYTYKLSTAELTTFLVFHSEGASELEVLQPLSTPCWSKTPRASSSPPPPRSGAPRTAA